MPDRSAPATRVILVAPLAALLAASAATARPDYSTPAAWKNPLDYQAPPRTGNTTAPGRFSVIGLPDTQRYSEQFPEQFYAQTEWIARNQRNFNISFVSHYGDLVQHGDDLAEWAGADTAMRTLDNAGVRYGVAPGNHDVLPSGSNGEPYIPQNYLDHFGPQRFASYDWYGGASPSGMSSWQTFEGGGQEFLALHLDVDTPIAELAWAQGVINAHRDMPVMVTTHRYLQDAEDYTGGVPIVPSGRYPDIWYEIEDVYSPNGIHAGQFFDEFVRMNKQVFLVNSGHFHEEYRQTSTNAYGQPVHEVLADYQDDPNGGNGFLRIMDFDLRNNRIDVDSYSPTLDQYLTKDESKFSLDVQFGDYQYDDPTVTFQQGIGGYAGTRDTWINEDSPGSSYGGSDRITVDDDVNNSWFSDDEGQGLLKFDGMFGDGEGQIPFGATITDATLVLRVADDIDFIYDPDFRIYMMTRDWSEASTWNSLDGGLDAGSDYSILLDTFSGDNDPDGDSLRMTDVAAAVQAWADGAPNHGFAILTQIIDGNDDGIELFSSEHWNPLLRPRLEVSYTLDGLATIPAPGTVVLLASGGLASARRRRRV